MHFLRNESFFPASQWSDCGCIKPELQFWTQNDTLLLWERHSDISLGTKGSWSCCLSPRSVAVKWEVAAKPWWQILPPGYVCTPLFTPPPATAAGWHYPALLEAYAGIIYARTSQWREQRAGKSLSNGFCIMVASHSLALTWRVFPVQVRCESKLSICWHPLTWFIWNNHRRDRSERTPWLPGFLGVAGSNPSLRQ